MKIEINVQDEKLQNLSPPAFKELEKISKHYLEEVLDEASRIEESRRTTNSNPEITATIINEAVNFARTYGIRKRKTKKHYLVQIVSFISTLLTGGLFDTEKFKESGYVLIFLIVFLVAIASNVYLIFNDNNND